MSENPSGNPATTEVATLGGGCFWCLEAVYDELKGVISVESGYMGGKNPHPTYEQVCGGGSGHAEVFFVIHDPTTLNRQGNDSGTQYRSAIFYHSPGQKTAAEQVMANLGGAGLWRDPVVTEVTAASVFYIAEAYHQEYFANNPGAGYCQFVVAPKVAKFRKHFLGKLKQ